MAPTPEPPRWAVRTAVVIIVGAGLWVLFLALRALTIWAW